MIGNNALLFLNKLKKNNNKEWFDEHRTEFKQIQTELIAFADAWIKDFSTYDASISTLEPKKCIFRIHKDVRFSKDKLPYKTNLGIYLTKGGKNSNLAGYYLHIEPNNCFFGAGNYMPMPEQLAKIRQEIDYNFKDFSAIVEHKKFKSIFGALNAENKLKKAPKGYTEDNPSIEFLKLKGFTVFTKLSDDVITSNSIVKETVKLSILAQPFVAFLNTAVE